MSNCADDAKTLDFGASVLNITNLSVGYTYGAYVDFFNEDGSAMDITGDDFRMEIRNSAGVLVETLILTGGIAVGGLEFSGTKRLNFKIGTGTTVTAGVYDFKIIIITAAYGDENPIVEGKIKVS